MPVSKEPPVETLGEHNKPARLKGTETILVVEDNPQVLDLTITILKEQGYKVLAADNAASALKKLDGHTGPLDLLLTDVVMPSMNGRELYEKVAAQYPGLRVLYMSGYTDDVVDHHGVLDQDVQFIQKPFSIHGLAAKVRAVLKRS